MGHPSVHPACNSRCGYPLYIHTYMDNKDVQLNIHIYICHVYIQIYIYIYILWIHARDFEDTGALGHVCPTGCVLWEMYNAMDMSHRTFPIGQVP